MNENFHVVIIDDHPLITEAYKAALENFFCDEKMDLTITTFGNIDEVLTNLTNDKFVNSIDLIFLDIQLPNLSNSSFLSGEDLGVRLKKIRPEIKIVVSTSLNDNYRVNSILKSNDPDGFLLKGDIDRSELLVAIRTLIYSPPYYSKTVLQLLRKKASSDYILDEFDRKMLYELSIGTKLKDLKNILPFSLGGIEKRRRNLKMIFDIEEEGDRSLILIAKQKGFI